MEFTTQGSAVASVPPELATLHVSAGFEGDSLEEVVGRASDLTAQLRAELEHWAAGPQAALTQWSVLPLATRAWRPWSDRGEQLPMRYAAHAPLSATLSDVAVLSKLADTWGRREGVSLGSVEWSLTPARRQDVEDDLLGEAVARARHRADVMARAAGCDRLRLVAVADAGLLSMAIGEPGVARFAGAARAMALDAAGASAEGGFDLTPAPLDVAVTVHARFAGDGAARDGAERDGVARDGAERDGAARDGAAGETAGEAGGGAS